MAKRARGYYKRGAVWLICGWVLWMVGPGGGRAYWRTFTPPTITETKQACEVELQKKRIVWKTGGVDDSTIVLACLPVGLTPIY